MRRGTINAITLSEGRGLILDEHNEEIGFKLKSLDKGISLGDEILFDIEYIDGGLLAVSIRME